MNMKTHSSSRVEYDAADWIFSIGGSFIIHVMLAVVIYLCSLSYQEPVKPLQAMDVDLASLPPAKMEPANPEPPPAKPVEPEKPAPEPVKKDIPQPVKEPVKIPVKDVKPVKKAVEPVKPVPVKKADIVLNDKNKTPKKIKEIKEATEPDPQEEIRKALKQLEKNTGEPPPEADPIASRLKKMSDEVKKSGPRPGTVTVDKGGNGNGNSATSQRYNAYLGKTYELNWSFSKNLAGGQRNLKAHVTFTVQANGEITGIKIIKGSGNDLMDTSVLSAIMKSSPVSPPPAGVKAPYVQSMWFAPKD